MDTKAETIRLNDVSPKASQDPTNDGTMNNLLDGEEYDPHMHRRVSKPTNDFESLIHLLKCSLGTGILAMPQGFIRAGLVGGILTTILAGILITYCLHLLVRCQYQLCKRRRVALLTYPESMAAALSVGPPSLRRFTRSAPLVVDIFLAVYQLGICCVYIVFIGKSLKAICDPYYVMSDEIHMLIILGPLLAFNCIRNLKLLAPFSTLANVLTLIGLGIVVYFLIDGEKVDEPIDLWGSLSTFPLFFGTVLFALTAVGVVVAIENNMKTPQSFGKPYGVLNIGMSFIVVLYVAVGALGYLFCKSKCQDSITLDLPKGDPLAISVSGLFAIAIFISYGLQCYVPVEVIWRGYLLPRLERAGSQHLLRWEYALRIGLCLLTFILAVAVPQLGLFISLFGALCLSALAICFPALMELCISFPDKFGRARLRLIKDILIFIVGIVGLIAGTYTALVEIVRTFF